MKTRYKAGLALLAAVGAFSSVQFLSGVAHAQGFGGGGGGQGGPPGGRRMMVNNFTATVTIDDAIKTATAKTSGYVNSAVLRPAAPPPPPAGNGPSAGQDEPRKMVWVIHVVTTPGTRPGPNSGKGEEIAVDASSNQVVPMPPRGNGGPPPPGGVGFGGGTGAGG